MRNIKWPFLFSILVLHSFTASAHIGHHHGHEHQDFESAKKKGFWSVMGYTAVTAWNVKELAHHGVWIVDMLGKSKRTRNQHALLYWNMLELFAHSVNLLNYGAEVMPKDSKEKVSDPYYIWTILEGGNAVVSAMALYFQPAMIYECFKEPSSAKRNWKMGMTSVDMFLHIWDLYYSASEAEKLQK